MKPEDYIKEYGELIQRRNQLTREERIRFEIWEEMCEKGKTDKEIAEAFCSFGLCTVLKNVINLKD